MKKNRYRGGVIVCLALFIFFLTTLLPLEPKPFLSTAASDHQEYDVDKFDENITIAEYSYQFIDFNFQEGEQIEIVFTLLVKQGIPINVWFMNEDNYLLFSSGAEQFLYYIDGSEREVIYTKNIVTLKEHDLYKLVMVNYNNRSVEVNVVYEIRTYTKEFVKTSSEDTSISLYILLVLVIILVVLLIALSFKIRKYKQATTKGPSKKIRKRKVKKVRPEVLKNTSSERSDSRKLKETELKEHKILEERQEEPEIAKEVTPSYCGYCGKPVDTPYCKICGQKVDVI
ncbi:MAG: hypothetical protein JSW00_17220 [Thermoplasmata archaeon]|nr:MAG: hypothetical protein JSW00_17220 [Thermoplasmata archaeon]